MNSKIKEIGKMRKGLFALSDFGKYCFITEFYAGTLDYNALSKRCQALVVGYQALFMRDRFKENAYFLFLLNWLLVILL